MSATARTGALLAAALWGDPRVEELHVAGRRALAAQPPREAPAVVFLNAATEKGLHQPYVARFLSGLARAGFAATAPELPGLAQGEITTTTLETAIDCTIEAARDGRVALTGASTGAGLAVLAAADPRLAGRVSVVGAVAPFADLRAVIARATVARDEAHPTLVSGVARSLRACASGDAVEAVLANRDPARVRQLLDALPPAAQAAIDTLSPIRAAAGVHAPVLIAAAPDDPFFPLSEAQALARACPDAHLTVSAALDHIRPRLGFELLPLVALLRRFLLLASSDRAEAVRLEAVTA